MAFSYFFIWFLLCCVQPLPCETQDVFFGLKDRSGAEQALFLGERNVTITCNVSCVENAFIKIKQHQERDWVTNNNMGTSLDYTIDKIFNESFSKFSCSVNYNATTSGGGVFNKSENVGVNISLPVLDHKNLTCGRNGPSFSKSYQTGDTLSLQCFCYLPATGPCQWFIHRDPELERITSTQSYSSNDTVLLLEAKVVNVNESSLFLCWQTNHPFNSKVCAINSRSPYHVFPTSKVLLNECDQHHIATTTGHTSFDKINTTTHMKEAVATVTKKTSPFENFFEELKNVSSEVLVLGVIGIVILVITICIIIVTGCLIRSAKVKIKEHDEEKKVPEESMYADIPEKMPESALSTDVDRLYDAPPFMTKGVVPNYYIKQQ